MFVNIYTLLKCVHFQMYSLKIKQNITFTIISNIDYGVPCYLQQVFHSSDFAIFGSVD